MRAPVKMLDLPGYVSLEVHEELRDQLATAEQERDAAQSRGMGLQEDVWNTAVKLAQGCHDYGGGYRGHEYEAFQHGISTVVCVLEKKRDGDSSYQMRMVETIGAAALAELAALQAQDAERYRWLRKGDLESMRVIGLPQTEDVYDRELDAEMAKAPHA